MLQKNQINYLNVNMINNNYFYFKTITSEPEGMRQGN